MEGVDLYLGGFPEVLGPRWKGRLVKGPRPKNVNRELFRKASLRTENR